MRVARVMAVDTFFERTGHRSRWNDEFEGHRQEMRRLQRLELAERERAQRHEARSEARLKEEDDEERR